MTDVPDRLLIFHPTVPMAGTTIEAFHEWNIAFAIEKFRAKPSNDAPPVTFFNFFRGDHVIVMESCWENDREKYAVFRTVRQVCLLDPAVQILSWTHEAWIASTESHGPDIEQLRAQYSEVRLMPGREDALVVTTSARNGPSKMTKWVVRIKPNPADSIMLARDDVDLSDIELYGFGANFFGPERHFKSD